MGPRPILPVPSPSGKARRTLRVAWVRRPWGLRFRMLAAAGVIALVSVITFGVLLEGLSHVSATTVKARASNDAYTEAGVLERLALELESAALQRGTAGVQRAPARDAPPRRPPPGPRARGA